MLLARMIRAIRLWLTRRPAGRIALISAVIRGVVHRVNVADLLGEFDVGDDARGPTVGDVDPRTV